jgi:hypothetical protein
VWSISEGLPPKDELMLGQYVSYNNLFPVGGLPADYFDSQGDFSTKALASIPVAYSSFNLPSGHACIMRTVPRMTRTRMTSFSHALVVDSQRWPFNPATILYNRIWRSTLVGKELTNTRPAPYLESLSTEHIEETNFNEQWLSKFLAPAKMRQTYQRVLNSLISGPRPVVLVDEARWLPYWMIALSLSLPDNVPFPFKSYKNPKENEIFSLLGTTPEDFERTRLAGRHQAGGQVVVAGDLENNSGDFGPYTQAMSTSERTLKGKIFAEAESFEDPSLDQRLDLAAYLVQWENDKKHFNINGLLKYCANLKKCGEQRRINLAARLFEEVRNLQLDALDTIVETGTFLVENSNNELQRKEICDWLWKGIDSLKNKPDPAKLKDIFAHFKETEVLFESMYSNYRMRDLIYWDEPSIRKMGFIITTFAIHPFDWPCDRLWNKFWEACIGFLLKTVDHGSSFARYLLDLDKYAWARFWNCIYGCDKERAAVWLKMIIKVLSELELLSIWKALSGTENIAAEEVLKNILLRPKLHSELAATVKNLADHMALLPEKSRECYSRKATLCILKDRINDCDHSVWLHALALVKNLRKDQLIDDFLQTVENSLPVCGPLKEEETEVWIKFFALSEEINLKMSSELKAFRLELILASAQLDDIKIELRRNSKLKLSPKRAKSILTWAFVPALRVLSGKKRYLRSHYILLYFFRHQSNLWGELSKKWVSRWADEDDDFKKPKNLYKCAMWLLFFESVIDGSKDRDSGYPQFYRSLQFAIVERLLEYRYNASTLDKVKNNWLKVNIYPLEGADKNEIKIKMSNYSSLWNGIINYIEKQYIPDLNKKNPLWKTFINKIIQSI